MIIVSAREERLVQYVILEIDAQVQRLKQINLQTVDGQECVDAVSDQIETLASLLRE